MSQANQEQKKKSRDLQNLEDAFSQGARKFSAFSVLGLDAQGEPEPLPEAGIENQWSNRDTTEGRPDRHTEEPRIDHDTQVLQFDHATEEPGSDHGAEGVPPGYDGATVAPPPRINRQTRVPRRDHKIRVQPPLSHELHGASSAIPLSPLQWSVWEALCEYARQGKRTTYQELADSLGERKRGVQRAVDALKREKAVQIDIIKTKEFQGFSVTIDEAIRFRRAEQSEVFGIAKRGGTFVPRNHGMTVAPGSLDPRMYVCKKNTYIHEDDLKALLRLAPAAWQIREQTLIQIADLSPTMTALEFRLSLKRLIDQAQNGRQPVKNPNAWLKAAFEKNGGPLVTEREIEARLENRQPPATKEETPPGPVDDTAEIQLLYIEATAQERAAIDAAIEQRVAPLLQNVAESHHAELRREARLEATREYFRKG